MSRLQRFYDNRARNYSLNWAIAFLVTFTFYTGIGILEITKYFQHHDPFYLVVGPFNTLLGAAGIFLGAQIIHAIFRRLHPQSPHPSH